MAQAKPSNNAIYVVAQLKQQLALRDKIIGNQSTRITTSEQQLQTAKQQRNTYYYTD